MKRRFFTGAGKVLLATINPSTKLPDAEGFRYVGNCDMVSIAMSGTNMTHREPFTGKELEDFRLFKQNNATFMLRLFDFTVENLQLALFGTKTANAGATVSDEVVVAPSNLENSVKLNNFNITEFTSLTNSGGTTTYVEGTDYKWTKWGFLSFPSGTDITASQSLKASYVAGTSETVNAFDAVQPRQWIMVEGLNVAESNAPVLIEIPLAVFDPIANWDAISTGKNAPEQIELRGSILYVEELDESGRIPGGFMKEHQLIAA